MPLSCSSHLTLRRSRPQQQVSAFIRVSGSNGLAEIDWLRSERDAIDAEFAEAGLPTTEWTTKQDEGPIGLTFAAPLPWNEAGELAQIDSVAAAANQFVNSLRPRLLGMGTL